MKVNDVSFVALASICPAVATGTITTRVAVMIIMIATIEVPADKMMDADKLDMEGAMCSSGVSSVARCHLRCMHKLPSSSAAMANVAVMDRSAFSASDCQK